MKCGGCGKHGKVAKGWRVRGKWWARCPECVAKWKEERLQEQRMDEEAFSRANDAA